MAPIDALTEARIRALEIIVSSIINIDAAAYGVEGIDDSTVPANQAALIRLAIKLDKKEKDVDDSNVA